jgi:pilus assembly protein FimV
LTWVRRRRPPLQAQEVVDLEKTIAGGSALDFDFNIGAPAAPQPAAKAEPALDLGAISLDLGEPSKSAEPPAGDDVATKLELAKAYEEMGDKEGARELLSRRLRQGRQSPSSRPRPRDMLAKLS